MPAISTRFPTTTTKSTYLPSESFRKSTYSSTGSTSGTSALVDSISLRNRSSFGSYRSINGDDISTASSRSGVSTRYTSSTSSSHQPSTTRTSFITRKSIDRDFCSKPPIGSRASRSDSRFRDLSLDNGYHSTTTSSINKSQTDSSHSLINSKRLSTSSLARSVATSGADLYDKYSVANYKPSCELSRSRSLTDSKIIDSLNANHHSSTRRSTSKDRSVTGSLLAGSGSDYISNRSTSPISASVKYVSNGTTNQLSNSIVVSSASFTNQNASSQKIPKKPSISSTEIGTKCGAIKKSLPKVTAFNGVGLNDTKNSLNITINGGKVNNSKTSIATSTTTNATVTTSTATTTANHPKQTMNGCKSINRTISNQLNNNNNNNDTKPVLSSESFKRRLGTNPLAPYKNPEFLKCEYDLARSQLINSRSRSACGEKNNHSNSELNGKTNGFSTSNSLTSSPAKDTNRNKVTIFGVNSATPITTTGAGTIQIAASLSDAIKSSDKITTKKYSDLIDNNSNSNENMNANCVQHTVDILDDIKFIDSDDSERRHSPSTVNVASLKELFNDNMALSKTIKNTSTLPTGASKKLNDIYANKYNTLNGSCGYQAGAHFANGIARKAVPEEMLSSTSSSTSTLSAMTESSTSSLLPKSAAKENGTIIKVNHLDGGDSVSIRNSSVRSALPPTPNRDGKSSTSISSRILPDTDAFTKSLAASSISDKTSDTENTEGLCGLRNIGNTCFMNSIIQCLSHTKDLTSYLKTKVDVRSTTAAKDSRIVTEFSKLIKEMWSGSTSSVTPSELKLAFSCKHRMYSGCSQQDAQEFLRFFLDALHCALNAGTKGEIFKKTVKKTVKPISKRNVRHSKQVRQKKTSIKNTIKFDLSDVFSSKDVNKDGMIKPEKVLEQNICDWNAVNYPCYKCNANFNTHSTLSEHFNRLHSNKKYQLACSMCQDKVLFPSNHEYRKHIITTHLPHLANCCNECNKFFIDSTKFRQHLRSHPSYVCSTCGKAFCFSSNLEFHQLSHQSIDVKFECYVCKESLLSYQSLRIHMKSHTKVKNVKRVRHTTKLSEQKKKEIFIARNDVKTNNISIYAAAKKYNITYVTLWKYCNLSDFDCENVSVGRPCYLGSNLENELKHWILEAAETGFPITQKQILFEARKYNEQRGLVNGWQPGPKWFTGFINRNPDMKRNIRTKNSKFQFITESDVRQWYEKTMKLSSEMNWGDADKIFSMDDVSFCYNPNLGKILPKRPLKCAKIEWDCCTVLLGANAAGLQIPPMIVYEGACSSNQIKQILPRGWHADTSISGFMTSINFFDYISKVFYPWLIEQGISTPVVIFIEGHLKHRSLQLSYFCSQHKIILISFLPNTRHIGQPMNVIENGALKYGWESMLNLFKNMYPNLERMPRPIFCDFLNKCLNESLTENVYQQAFDATAIFPFDPNRFDYSKLSST